MRDETTSSRARLSDLGRNEYSQFGEDGIVAAIFERISARTRVCVEFGAWDGFHLSNTAALWTRGWRGVLIEGDRRRFHELQANTEKYGCVCINAWVMREGPSRLEALLERAGVVSEVDLLSIDIDGDDFYVLESLERLRPRVIICEYNPTIPADVDLHAEYGSSFGASVAALTRVARDKGYELVALTQTNCFFVLREETTKLSEFETKIEKIRCDDQIVYLMTSYTGDYVTSRPPPYGLRYPYRGPLIGPYHRAIARNPALRWWAATFSRSKRSVKRLMGRA
jgi:hypothetical protein